MALSPLMYLFFTICFVHQLLAQSTGSAGCPCIDPGALANQAATLNGSNPDCLLVRVNRELYCYPKDYGSSVCQTWDTGLAPECNIAVPPAYCGDRWCWVDPNNCNLPFKSTQMLTVLAYYSYETCSNPNQNTQNYAPIEYAGATIRVGLPTGYDIPYYYIDTTGDGLIDIGNNTFLTGAIVKFALDVLAAASINFTIGAISNVSLALYPLSPYTACVHSVSMGLLDLCIGPFVETSARQALTSMGSIIYSQSELLVTSPVTSNPTFLDLIVRVFQPFTWQLWVTILGIVVGFGLLLWLNTLLQENPIGVLEGQFLSLAIFCPGGDSPIVGGRILFVAIGIFVVLVTATYTAGLASFLVSENAATAQVQSLQDVSSTGTMLCFLSPLQQQLIALQPDIKPYLIPFPGDEESVAALLSGQCGAALIGTVYLDRVTGGALGSCGLLATAPNPITSVPIAFPMSDSLVPTMGYWQRKILESKPFESYMNDYKEASKCDTSSSSSSSSASIDAPEMMGLWVMLGCLIFLWILVTLFRVISRWHKRKNSKKLMATDAPGAEAELEAFEENCDGLAEEARSFPSLEMGHAFTPINTSRPSLSL